MRLFALAVTAALALPATAFAQTLPALPSLDETPAQRTARRAAMTPPVLQEDAALQAVGPDPEDPRAEMLAMQAVLKAKGCDALISGNGG